jgi:hypothetical protein
VLDRPKLPPNNIISGDNALKTHGIWTQTISGSNNNTHNAGPATHGPTLTRQHFTPRTNDAVTRGGCKKCGAAGHLSFQCRNFLSIPEPEEKSRSEVEEVSREDSRKEKKEKSRKRKRSYSSSSSSDSSDSESDSSREERRKEKKEKRKEKRRHKDKKHKKKHKRHRKDKS